eukprot:TRINITY_DN48014_c0_g1_i1.p1 TRINITY_DN48014_c0_g1~~TRINITY_DN48014_c0_g1_i1.p1  ORF type:complete len:428 (-),score=74.44 TRINITY_DN48014_c0_g1_i1:41-1324(-)
MKRKSFGAKVSTCVAVSLATLSQLRLSAPIRHFVVSRSLCRGSFVSREQGLSTESSQARTWQVPRVHAQAISSQELNSLVRDGPVLLSGALADLDEKQWCSDLRRHLGSETVVCQHQTDGPSDPMAQQISLDSFIDEKLPESSHHSPNYVFEETLLLAEKAHEADLPQRLTLPQRLFGENWFNYFPKRLQPSPFCLVCAGSGSRSTLHRDPFEWTGTSFCVSGSKLWTFLPPGDAGVEAVDSALKAYRFPYDGYGQESLAAGWQSDLDLYEHSAGRASLEEEVVAEELRQWWAGCLDHAPALQPSVALKAGLPDDVVPTCAIQREGDLLLIPGHWWHQTYALQPSLAVSGQYMNEANSEAVMRHVAAWVGSATPQVLQRQSSAPEDIVHHFLEHVLSSQKELPFAETPWTMDETAEDEFYFSADELD